MIVLQPIADTAHIVHGPIACSGNSWESRGTVSSHGNLHNMGFTTDMNELDIVYGSEDKLYNAIIQTYMETTPKAIFVYSTCVSGLIGEDINAVCKKAEDYIGSIINCGIHRTPVIPVQAPGFVGPKNLGNRIAGEVLLEHVIGTGEPECTTDYDINIIGEYNIAGDLWLIEPLLKEAGIRILSRITGDSTFDEITYAHRAKLNVVVCSRAVINIAHEMQRRYGIPYVEVSFFGATEVSKALRAIAASLAILSGSLDVPDRVEAIITREEQKLADLLKPYEHLKGKRAVLYTGGVKSWSIISALQDLGIGIAAVGTKKSTYEDEQKMGDILGTSDVPLVEDVTAGNLLRLMAEGEADILIAGGRNQYLAVKEGFAFVDVNQERHTAYAGYEGLVNFARQIRNSVEFFNRQTDLAGIDDSAGAGRDKHEARDVLINPLKHSPALGAAIAFQGIHNALPVIHGAQGCGFLGKVLLTKHFREPIALANTKLFTEDVVMGSDDALMHALSNLSSKNDVDIIAVLSSGLSEVKGDDIAGAIKTMTTTGSKPKLLHVATPDYDGGLEDGYAGAVLALIDIAGSVRLTGPGPDAALGPNTAHKQINVLVGSHLTPADFSELREIIESFGLRPIILPDLSALDGSRLGFSTVATGGTGINGIKLIGSSAYTIAIGMSMEPAAQRISDRFDIDYLLFESIAGLDDADVFMRSLEAISGTPIPEKYNRQRNMLVDTMRDAHFYYGGKKVCLALEPDLAAQTSRWLYRMGADVELAVVPTPPAIEGKICADTIVVGDLHMQNGSFDLLVASSHGELAAERLGVPLYQMGFPVYKVIGHTSKVTIGYRGTICLINAIANMIMNGH